MIPVGEKAEVTLTKLSIFLIAQFLTISYIYPLELLSETRFKIRIFINGDAYLFPLDHGCTN